MNALQSTQNAFQRYLMEGADAIVAEIAGPDDAFRQARLGIYYDAYRFRLVEVLGSDFEVLKALVGDEVFDSIARAYLDSHPSIYRNVRWFGQKLSDFLGSDVRYRDHPILKELAAFEWLLGCAFDAPDAPVLSFDQLAGLPADQWADIRFRLHPSLQRLAMCWNVIAIWNAIDGKHAVPAPALLRDPVALAIWRHDYKSHFRSLPADEAQVLSAASDGASFPEICEHLSALHGEGAAPRAATLLRGWVDQGWLTSFVVSDADEPLSRPPCAPGRPHRLSA
jgi:Putative DNA-binding domain